MSEPYDDRYEAAVVAMLTLRINTPRRRVAQRRRPQGVRDLPGGGDRSRRARQLAIPKRSSMTADGEVWGHEYMLLSMMNAAWLAIAHLEAVTGESQSTWLQRIATDLRGQHG
jgi:hypothetical protein